MRDSTIRRALSSGRSPSDIPPALKAAHRAEELLRAALDLLTTLEDSHEDALSETVLYDDAECDGFCLRDDIEAWIDEHGAKP